MIVLLFLRAERSFGADACGCCYRGGPSTLLADVDKRMSRLLP